MPEDIWTPDGLRTFLTGTDSLGTGKWDRPPRVRVDLGDAAVDVDAGDLDCSNCGGSIDPPADAPSRYLAVNKALYGETLCRVCMTAPSPSLPLKPESTGVSDGQG